MTPRAAPHEHIAQRTDPTRVAPRAGVAVGLAAQRGVSGEQQLSLLESPGRHVIGNRGDGVARVSLDASGVKRETSWLDRQARAKALVVDCVVAPCGALPGLSERMSLLYSRETCA